MNKLLVICGPTATGKTELGIKLAKKYNGEIISADSRQVYKGMDIGTGKDLDKFSVGKIPVWLVDVCQPDQEFSAAHFVKFSQIAIKKIWKKGKLPIIVGGTGFWIKALTEGVESLGIAPDQKLRQQLSNETIEQLNNKLKKLNYQRWLKMNQSDRNNPRRLVRAIEIGMNKYLRFKIKDSKLKIESLLMIGLKTKDYQSLYKKINKRVEERIKQGASKEVKSLLKKGYKWDLPSFSATGYRVWQDYFQGRKTLEQIIQRWQYDEHGLARRQLSFLKQNKKIKWFDINNNIKNKAWQKKIEKLINQWYSNFNGKN